MSVSRHMLASCSMALCVLAFSAPGANAQPDPAVPGVCYATLGNNGSVPGALITVNTTTGAGTLVGATGILGEFGDPGVPALAIKSTGEMYATDISPLSKLYRVDATTGAATVVAITTLSSPPAIAFDGADNLWAVDTAGSLYLLNDATGVSQLVGATGAFIKGLAFDPIDGVLWGTDASGGVFTIDVHTGAATLVGNTGLAASPDIHFAAAGTLYASSGGGLANNNLITIDKTTGAGTVVGAIGFASVAGLASRLDRIVPVAVQAYQSSWTGSRVKVTWRLIDMEGAITFDVSRAENLGEFYSVSEVAIEEKRHGEFVLIDDAVTTGMTYRYRVVVREGTRAITSFETSVTTPTLVLSLDQNYPNPFNPATQIRFTVDSPVNVSLEIYDVAGRLVDTLIDSSMPSGTFSESWDGRDSSGRAVAGGIYFYRLTAGKRVLTRKMILIK